MFEDNDRCYGVGKMYHQPHREGHPVARCRVRRLMRELGIHGLVRGKTVCTTRADQHAPRPDALVGRDFHAPAPNRLWVADLTYIRTWGGWVYAAFVIDVYSRTAVGWQLATHLRTCAPTWRWMPWRRLCGVAGPTRTAALTCLSWCIIRTAGCNTCRFATPSVRPKPVWSARREAAVIRMTTPWPSPSTHLQDRIDPPARPLDRARRGGAGDAGIPRLVQPPPPPHRLRSPPTGRVRSDLLPSRPQPRHDSRNPVGSYPSNPDGFTKARLLSSRADAGGEVR